MHRSFVRGLIVTAAVVVLAPWSAQPAKAAPAWSWQLVPFPDSAEQAALHSVDCVTETVCTAVGWKATGSIQRSLAARWNGGSGWVLQSAVSPTGDADRLEGVSCVAGNSCLAVGIFASNEVKAFAEKWNGSSWAIKTMLNPGAGNGGDTVASDIGCTGASACTAVGGFWNGTYHVPIAQRWNGTGWTKQTVPRPTDATTSALTAVDCTSPTFCMGAGYFIAGTKRYPLAGRWNGSAWSLIVTPLPGATDSSEFTGVSCTSATACTVVGFAKSGTTTKTLVERWNGSQLTLQTSANVAGAAANVLNDVSCTTATACTAVGYSEASGEVRKTLAQRWNGTSWTITPTPTLRPGTAATLLDVDCTAAAACTAVGSYKSGTAGVRPLAERYAEAA